MHEIDYPITGLAFDIHNEFGRLWDEKIYQDELADRCSKAGLANVKTEAAIAASYRDFVKVYFVDVLVNDSKDIEVMLNEKKLGRQKIHMLNSRTAFKLTAITKGLDGYRQHLRRFIRLTSLSAIQWINFNHRVISFETILKQKK